MFRLLNLIYDQVAKTKKYLIKLLYRNPADRKIFFLIH